MQQQPQQQPQQQVPRTPIQMMQQQTQSISSAPVLTASPIDNRKRHSISVGQGPMQIAAAASATPSAVVVNQQVDTLARTQNRTMYLTFFYP